MAGFGNLGGSDSSAEDSRLDSSGAESIGSRGKGANARDNARAASSNAMLAEAGAIQLKGSKLNTGLDLSKVRLNGDAQLTVNLGDGGAAALELAGEFQDTLKALQESNAAGLSSLSSANTETNKSLADKLTSTISDALAKVTALAEVKATDGLSQVGKIFVGIIIAGAVVGVVALSRKKKHA